jgi:hypothetical protein
VVAEVAAAGQAHPVAGEVAEHLGCDRFLADGVEKRLGAVSVDASLIAGGLQGGDAGFQVWVVQVGYTAFDWPAAGFVDRPLS